MKVVAVASQKGGAGKTTLTVHLAICAVMAGVKAAVIDTDPQASLSDWWNVRKENDLPFVISTVAELPAKIKALSDAGIEMLFIDTPPAVTDVIRDVVSLANIIVIPTKPSPLDVRAISKTVDIVESCDKPMMFVISIAKKNARITGETAVLLSQFGTVAPVQVGDRTEYASCMIDGRTVMEVYPNGNSAEEMRQLWKYVQTQVTRRVK